MAGPNELLDKGFYVDPASTAVNFGCAAVYSSVSQGNAAVLGDTVKAAATSDTGNLVIGVFQETLDAAKVTTGKSTVNVRMMGIARVVSDGAGAITVGQSIVLSAATAGQFKGASATVGNQRMVGFAMSPAAAVAGAVFDLFLTPGANLNTAVS
jgi:hypothetical protein